MSKPLLCYEFITNFALGIKDKPIMIGNMNYNDINSYTYFTKPYAYGWMVYRIVGIEHVMEMCFTRQEDALSYATSLNQREAKRVAEAKERLESARKNIIVHETPYYSITGYYGD